ncbi:MAG: hypothetical protein IJO63_03820 [Bacilli bacterium]|nr:hypothetical protein [Bacilli bacterium]
MKRFPNGIDPNLYALVGIAIAAVLSDDFNYYELNSLGNWLELIGQYILTIAAQESLNNHILNGNNNFNINDLIRAINKIESELEKIKKEI